MDYVVVCAAGLAASALTLFSGFGLGTLLMPVFAVFFPIELAVAATAVVHLLNNLFKAALVGREADIRVAIRFGGPAALAAFAGAWTLLAVSGMAPLVTYSLGGRAHDILPIEAVIAALMLVFAALDVLPRFERMAFGPQWLPAGGLLSGFFGGLSGHQGALRSAFLARCGLTTPKFVGTGVVIACFVDTVRLAVYQDRMRGLSWEEHGALLTAASVSAFLGAWIGARLMRKVTMAAVQRLVAGLLALIAVGIGSGLM